MYSVSAPMLSVGLSDLVMCILPRHSPSPRSGLCWYRIGLSDLGGVVDRIHSPSLRFGLCWYRIGLSDLAAPKERLYTDTSYHRIPPRYKEIVVPLARQLRQLLPAPTERHDTSIAQRAMSMIHPKFQGLKDRWILCMAETSPPPSIGLSDLMIDLASFVALRATLVSDRSVGAKNTRI